MALHTVTFHLPDALYDRLKRRAMQAHRSVENEVVEVLTTAVPVADDLLAGIAEALSPLALLDDKAL